MANSKATFSGRQLFQMLKYVLSATAGNNRYLDKCFSVAEERLGGYLKLVRELEGGFRVTVPTERVECELCPETLYGLKTAFAQAWFGSQERPAATHAERTEIRQMSNIIGKKFSAALDKALGIDEKIEAPAAEELDLQD